MKTVTFDRVMGNINHCATWPKAAINRLEFGKGFSHGQMGRLFFGFPWQKFLSLALKHLLLENVVPWHLNWYETGLRQTPTFNPTYFSMQESPSNWKRGSFIHGHPLKGEWQLENSLPDTHPFWEVGKHLPNLRQILNTSLFSIEMMLCP